MYHQKSSVISPPEPFMHCPIVNKSCCNIINNSARVSREPPFVKFAELVLLKALVELLNVPLFIKLALFPVFVKAEPDSDVKVPALVAVEKA